MGLEETIIERIVKEAKMFHQIFRSNITVLCLAHFLLNAVGFLHDAFGIYPWYYGFHYSFYDGFFGYYLHLFGMRFFLAANLILLGFHALASLWFSVVRATLWVPTGGRLWNPRHGAYDLQVPARMIQIFACDVIVIVGIMIFLGYAKSNGI